MRMNGGWDNIIIFVGGVIFGGFFGYWTALIKEELRCSKESAKSEDS